MVQSHFTNSLDMKVYGVWGRVQRNADSDSWKALVIYIFTASNMWK